MSGGAQRDRRSREHRTTQKTWDRAVALGALGVALAFPSALGAAGGEPEPAPATPEPAPAEPAPTSTPEETEPPAPSPAPAPPDGDAPSAAVEPPAAAPDATAGSPPVRERPRPAERPEPAAVTAASGSVAIADFSFSPGTIAVNVGDTVTWRNSGPSVHSATAADGSFDTGLLKRGQSGAHTFTSAGSFAYVCTPHPFMKGTVRVTAAASAPDRGSSPAARPQGSGGSAPAGAAADSSTAAPQATGPILPATGAEPGTLGLLGLCMAATGLVVRRRLSR